MLSVDLIAAYCWTTYWVDTPGDRWGVRIGQVAAMADWLLQRHTAAGWMILTAANPASQPLGDAQNAARNAELRRQLEAQAWPHWPTQAEADRGDWPPEDGWLVLLPERRIAADWAARFDQHAVVAGTLGQAARLVFVPDPQLEHVLTAAAQHPDPTVAAAARAAKQPFF